MAKGIPLKKLVPELDDLMSTDLIFSLWGVTNPSTGGKLKTSLESFLALLNVPNIKTIEDIVQFNNDHADAELPPGKQGLS